MPLLRRVPFLATVLLLSLAACSTQPQGSVQFAASIPQALTSSDITRVKVTVSAADMSAFSVDLAKTNGSWGGFISNIPAGSNRAFLAEAFDSSGTLRFQGQTSGVAITANQTTVVAITLQELAPPPPYGNEAPIIDSAVASISTVQTGGSISLTATTHDPNTGDTLTFAWTASSGTFSAPTAAITSWTAPAAPGAQTLTFTVTDSQGVAASFSLAVNVVSGAPTNSELNISFNLWPVVSKLSTSRSRLDVGQSTSVSATASDADGDALSYQWAASPTCPGTWTNATASTASFVPSSVPPGVCNNCKLTVTVLDGRGGQTTGALNLCIAAASTERFPPRFTNFHPSATSLSPGQTVTFDVTAMDPQSSSLTFAWTANTGSLGAAQSTATTSHGVWTAPSCAATGVTPTVTASVTNAYGLSASLPFSLSGLPACASGWSSAGAMSTGRSQPTATVLSSGKVLVTGGFTSGGARSSAEVYDPATNSWSTVAPMATVRYVHTATLLPSGKVLIVGGSSNGSSALASAELYDPATNSWSSAGSMATSRYYHTATLLPSGKVLVVGGTNGGALSSAELYDPATNTWALASPMASSRYYHTATLLPSGKVLIAGGSNGSALSSAEVYDPATNAWSSVVPMASARQFHTATLFSSGKVLVVGGVNPSALASAEEYNPATNTWSSAGALATARTEHTATLLSSGKVLVTGGYNGSVLASTELYDPATRSWSSAGSLASVRVDHTATLLPAGTVLISGGGSNFSGTIAPTAAELYTP
jgi:N-acetylneuraminic acid mutarotase